jgi:hypothetical protein
MGRCLNTLKGSDVTITPIKLKYSNQIESSSLSSNNITLTVASNQNFDYNNPSYDDNFLLYRSIQGLYYMNFISGSLIGSASAYQWNPQSTAASGTFDDDYRYFPTESGSKILVISIPRAKYGENIARSSFSISSSGYNIVDDGNGNLVDLNSGSIHVGNLLYNQGIGIITNSEYIYSLVPIPVCDVPIIIDPIPVGSNIATPRWEVPNPPTIYQYALYTSSISPIGSGTEITSILNTGSINFTGLSSSTEYYFYLRTKCSSTSFSNWVSKSFTTRVGLVPLRDGLIMELESFTGSISSSGYITQWDDMSGFGNNVYRDSSQYQPVYVSSYFNNQPGIFFSASGAPNLTGSVLRTSGNLIGLSGSTGVTAFIVSRPSSSLTSGPVIEYAKLGTSTDSYLNSTGSFQYYQVFTGGGIVTAGAETRGNVGISGVEDSTVRTQSQFYIESVIIDYTLSSKEVTVYTNNSTGSLTWSEANNSGSFESYPLAISSGVNNGRWQGWQGYIGAVLLYNRALNESERTQVYNYLSSSYLQ